MRFVSRGWLDEGEDARYPARMRPFAHWILVAVFLAACGRADFSAPCEEDGDCERKLACLPANAPQSAIGQTCSHACSEEDLDCGEGGLCWGFFEPSCIRTCDTSAPDCPEGTICAVQELGEWGADPYCVLPCNTDADCQDSSYPFCPVPGGPCSESASEAPHWAAALVPLEDLQSSSKEP